ncbi:MAG: DUF1329 domain-containing protein [Deltaproteobacteria bacterium]|nr:DUF1329 domain-containing protein [Deltaproteobacteria bacterium]
MKRLATASLVAAMLLTVALPALAEGAFTKDNWTEKVGFKPDLSVPGYKAGMVIDASNWSSFKKYVPAGLEVLITKYKLALQTAAYKPVHPSTGYIEATNKYLGQPQIIDTGSEARKIGMKNYTAGLPFPNPKNGLEVAWNYQYSYNGDDGTFHYGVYWISAKDGVERWEEWVWEYIIRTINRTDIAPIPAIEQFQKKNVQYTSMTYAIQPYDKRGFGALYSRYIEPKDQEGWIYVPTMKRELRNTFGSRGDAWNSTDLLYEDVRGFMGYPEWMNWKLVEKRTIMATMHAGIPGGKEARDKVFDFDTWPHWNPKMKWEPRPVYVLEVTPKFKDYPYSKMIMYVDSETYYIVLKEAYDKKGKLWKVLINAYNDSKDMNKYPPGIGTSLIIDLQAEHATAFPSYNFKANVGLKPGKFKVSTLRKMGK